MAISWQRSACLVGLFATIMLCWLSRNLTVGGGNGFSLRSTFYVQKNPIVAPEEDKNTVKSASTGGVSSGIRVNKFDGTLRLQQRSQTGLSCKNIWPVESKFCDKWAVVTTINSPTNGVRSVAALKGWCMVIVGDTKTRVDYVRIANFSKRTHVVFLSADQQRRIRNQFVEMIPFQSFARKNVGFLFAIQHGAKTIYDFDDDNVIKDGLSPFGRVDHDHSQFLLLRRVNHNNDNRSLSFNPLPHMNPSVENIWPRGFPLNDVMRQPPVGDVGFASIKLSSLGVVQAVCDGDPDFDAIFRLTRKLPITFESDPKMTKRLLVPTGKYSPYNAQATVHMYKAFWGLFLPSTVPGRVTDIWRSFITQKFFHELGLVLIYEGPLVKHERSPHDYLADFQAELDLYSKTPKLLEFLSTWKYDEDEKYEKEENEDENDSYFLPARIERLTIDLYERDYIGLTDVYATQEWLLALICSGYVFPKRQRMGIQSEPSTENQPFLTSPAFNIGRNGKQYHEISLGAGGAKMNLSSWMELNRPFARPSEQAVLKLVLINKDEWPKIQDWVWYHGALLGFQNLYIVDGSSKPDSIHFLAHVRDHHGVNVVFSTATLSSIEAQLTKIGRNVSKSCDLMMKMDTDEFLVASKGTPNCENVSGLSLSRINCFVSPYAVNQALKTIRSSMFGERLLVGFQSRAIPTAEICSSPAARSNVSMYTYGKLAVYSQNVISFKAISDSRTFLGFDLGGHKNHFVPPFGSRAKQQVTQLGIIHIAHACIQDKIQDALKAVISHGFIQENDTYEMMDQRFRSRYNVSRTAAACSLSGREVHKGMSFHKSLIVWKYIAGCNYTQEYSTINSTENWDFVQFLRKARTMYADQD